jgi:hypothetical protein
VKKKDIDDNNWFLFVSVYDDMLLEISTGRAGYLIF